MIRKFHIVDGYPVSKTVVQDGKTYTPLEDLINGVLAQYDGKKIEVKDFQFSYTNDSIRIGNHGWVYVTFYVEIQEDDDFTKEEFESIREELVQAQDEIRTLRIKVEGAENVLNNYKAGKGIYTGSQASGTTYQINKSPGFSGQRKEIWDASLKSTFDTIDNKIPEKPKQASYEPKKVYEKPARTDGYDEFFHDAGDGWGK